MCASLPSYFWTKNWWLLPSTTFTRTSHYAEDALNRWRRRIAAEAHAWWRQHHLKGTSMALTQVIFLSKCTWQSKIQMFFVLFWLARVATAMSPLTERMARPRESRYIIFDLRTLLFGQYVLCDNATMTCQKWREENFEKEFRPQVWVAVLSWERARSEYECSKRTRHVYLFMMSTRCLKHYVAEYHFVWKPYTHTDALVCVSIRMAFELRMQNNK